MKVIIAGSRSMPIQGSQYLIDQAVRKANYQITEVVSGNAGGADTWGEVYAHRNHLQLIRFRADWERYGRHAGTLRNIQMGDYADAAIIFIYNHSRGSEHMLAYMKHLKKPYLSVFDGQIDYAF